MSKGSGGSGKGGAGKGGGANGRSAGSAASAANKAINDLQKEGRAEQRTARTAASIKGRLDSGKSTRAKEAGKIIGNLQGSFKENTFKKLANDGLYDN